ncbi:MAG: hypothetical protein KKD01_11020 [Proteobacteria bacterium]|nr:hypothetical protein [Pseudomonadota bacterium]MBU1139814.1 hypothetical protein [Pseudomonadota bacterium]MBU1232790.1 hypothetical protein [Pseudomonadota bacterium]MBU1418966.1 hypothetical protein [Pseudomonadota bacterium]MBU1455246.1 hypothetical protein [Pseudomonadota bacterium]
MSAERTVEQVINIARQWIEDKYGDRADFIGAHLVGSLHHMPFASPFLAYRDVDLGIILDSITEQDIDDTNHEGLIMEAILAPVQRYESAEELLADAWDQEKQIFEKLHQLLGSQHVTPDAAEDLLAKTIEAFDYALTIHKTPIPYEHKLKACIRPYLVEGTLEMFNEDGYRESIFWITLFMMISCAAIQADAPAEEQAKHLGHAREHLQIIGLATPEDIRERIQLAQTLLEEMKQLTDHIIATSPDLFT